MKKVSGILVFMLFLSAASAQSIQVYDSFEEYKSLLQKNNDTTYVVNFWATYCAPCIEEMPAFRKLEKNYGSQAVKIILTSLDFGSNVKDRVRAFMKKHDVRSSVVILDDPKSNSWIDKVSPDWSGALPGTLIYNSNYREFHEKTFTYNELQKIIESKMMKP